MKNIIKQILREEINQKVISKVLSQLESGRIKPPYYKNLDDIGLDSEEIKVVLEKFIGGEMIDSNPVNIVNDGGDEMYLEFNDGSWVIRQYDENGRITYMKDSSNYWYKKEYDKNGGLINYSDSEGVIKRYDDKGSLIYHKNNEDGIVLDNR